MKTPTKLLIVVTLALGISTYAQTNVTIKFVTNNVTPTRPAHKSAEIQEYSVTCKNVGCYYRQVLTPIKVKYKGKSAVTNGEIHHLLFTFKCAKCGKEFTTMF